jgi:glycine oxidase
MPAGVSSTQVAIVGGGVIGACCARAAAQRGLEVTLFAPGPDPRAASSASAGMLAAQIEPADMALLPLAVRSRDLYESLASELKDSTGIDIGFQPIGIATVAFEEDRAAALIDVVADQRQAGLRCDWLEATELHERWPGVAPQAVGALFAPEDGALDPTALVRALLADVRQRGVVVEPEPVSGVSTAGGRVMGVTTASSSRPAEQVVIAAGAWSPSLVGLPRHLPIEPVRGQLLATAWPESLPPMILYHGHKYILQRQTEAILGSTMERVGFDSGTTPEGLADIRRIGEQLCPALAHARQRRAWAGLRPVTPDGRPILGPDPDLTGLWYATGHGRNGILLAAITGEIIADLMTSGRTEHEITPLAVSRFSIGAAGG